MKALCGSARAAGTGDLTDIEGTIIDGSRPRHLDSASVVVIANQEDSTTQTPSVNPDSSAGSPVACGPTVKLEFRNNVVWGNTQAKGDQFDFQQDSPLTLG